MSYGFGNGLPGMGPRGLRADQPPPSQSDDIHAIRVRYCGPSTLNPQTYNLAANAGARFDLTGTAINAIIITSLTGQVNGWWGDFSSGFGKSAVTPHFVGSASLAPNTDVIPLPPGDNYIITIQEGVGGTASGTITFAYL